MPSYKQEINVDLNSIESGVLKHLKKRQVDEAGRPNNTQAEGVAVTAPPTELSAEKQRAFELRDFVSTGTELPSEEPSVEPWPFSRVTIPYIDEPAVEDGTQSDEERQPAHDTEDVLNNAACRLLRWRAASRKLRRPRIIDNLGSEEGRSGGRTDLADRMRSLSVAPAGELLSLSQPPPAATAPSSPGFLLTPSLADQSTAEYFGSSPECCADNIGFDSSGATGAPAPPPGPRYKLIKDGSLRVCFFQHTRTVMDKILAAKFLRRWETHVLCLEEDQIVSKTPSGLLEKPLQYSSIQEIYCISRWDSARKYCLRIVMCDGSLLFQAKDAYTRDQWYHSIIWRGNMIRYQSVLKKSVKKEVVLKELKKMVDYVMTTPLQDESVTRAPMQILSNLLSEDKESPDWEDWAESVTSSSAPMLAERCVSQEVCGLLARLCRRRPRAAPLPALAPPVRRVLTRNVDFAKAPEARRLVRDYISALSAHNSGQVLVRRFVSVTHGWQRFCPRPLTGSNLAAVAVAALNDHYRDTSLPHTCDDREEEVLCFADVLEHMSEYTDWKVGVAVVLAPVPLCTGALRCPRVGRRLKNILKAIITNEYGFSVLLGPRPSEMARVDPPFWLKVAGPSDPQIVVPQRELLQLWGDILGSIMKFTSNKKRLLQNLSKQLPDFVLVALTEHPAALEALCLMLEWDIVSGEQTQLEIIATLQGTELGQKHYKDLCEKQQRLQILQSEGGPKTLALPVRATDDDVAALLEAGSLGNLECLSLAFTNVTSECAKHLIKLPSLRYLNLWATKFGNTGLTLIAEHLPRLQVLNLCETPVSDYGIEALSALKSLRRLNLNSTKLSTEAFEELKKRLPQLQEFDIRYTEAW